MFELLIVIAVSITSSNANQGFEIESFTNKCLDDAAHFTECNGAINQKWKYQTDTLEIINEFNSKCLDIVEGKVHENGASVIMYDCNSGYNQKWTYDQLHHKIINVLWPGNPGKCLDIHTPDIENKKTVPVFIWDCNNNNNQKFDMPDYAAKLNNKNEWVDTTWEEYPFMAKLTMITEAGPSYCGGSIVSLDAAKGNGVILTAAHCVDGVSQVKVQIGCTQTICNDGKTYDADDWYMHPNYAGQDNQQTFLNNDIALVYLTQPITHPNARPIELLSNMDSVENNAPIKALGYLGLCNQGANCVGGSDLDTLEYTMVNFMPEDECYNKWKEISAALAPAVLNNEEFCVVDDTYDVNGDLSSVCNGDSGSPWLFNGKQIGITSWVEKNCNPNFPSVATNVATYNKWIEEYIGGITRYIINAKVGIGYVVSAEIDYRNKWNELVVQGPRTASVGFSIEFIIPSDATNIGVMVDAVAGFTVFAKFYENTQQLDGCHKFDAFGTVWLEDYENLSGGSKTCRDASYPKWEDGILCGMGTTCNACQNKATYWSGKAFTACGSEPKWGDGSICALGTTCNACQNGATYWPSKAATACGREPCWGRGTTCGSGTTCHTCCSGNNNNHCPWYWFGVCQCG